MSGHLHRLLGISSHLKSKMSDSHYELEVADLKESNIFRVAAIDNDLFSFIDVSMHTKPIILITNPKDARYLQEHEPVYKMKESTHIRMLIFSPKQIQKIEIHIDDEKLDNPFSQITEHLFVVEWDPKKYISGVHNISVYAFDGENENSVSYMFSLDGTKPPRPFKEKFSDLVLLFNWTALLQAIFLIIYIIIMLILVISKLYIIFMKYYKKKEIPKDGNKFYKYILLWPISLAENHIIHSFLLIYLIIVAFSLWNYWVFGYVHTFLLNLSFTEYHF